MDEDDYDWRPAGINTKKLIQSPIRSKRVKTKKHPMQIYVPKTEIKTEDEEMLEGVSVPKEIIYETTEIVDGGLEGESQNKIISITKKEPEDPLEGEDPNDQSIKFTVKTRGAAGEDPVEFEVELKDQKLIASGQLEDHTQTVMNLLSEGNVVDAILQNLAGEKMVEEILPDKSLIETPKKRWESKKFLCDDCGFTCASKTTLNTHKMFKHGDLPPKSLTCDQCDYICDHPTQLTSHKRIIHEEKLEPLECAHCPLQVRTQAELDKHLRNIHSEEKPFVCNVVSVCFCLRPEGPQTLE
jgi:hypothetical protein